MGRADIQLGQRSANRPEADIRQDWAKLSVIEPIPDIEWKKIKIVGSSMLSGIKLYLDDLKVCKGAFSFLLK